MRKVTSLIVLVIALGLAVCDCLMQPVSVSPDASRYLVHGRDLWHGDLSALLFRPLMSLLAMPVMSASAQSIVLFGTTVTGVMLMVIFASLRSMLPAQVVLIVLFGLIASPIIGKWSTLLLPDFILVGLALATASLIWQAIALKKTSLAVYAGVVAGLSCLVKETGFFTNLWLLVVPWILCPRQESRRITAAVCLGWAVTLIPWTALVIWSDTPATAWGHDLPQLAFWSSWNAVVWQSATNIPKFVQNHMHYGVLLPLLLPLIELPRSRAPHHVILIALWVNWLPTAVICISMGWRAGQYLVPASVLLVLMVERLHHYLQARFHLAAYWTISAAAIAALIAVLLQSSSSTDKGWLAEDAQLAGSLIARQDLKVATWAPLDGMLRLHGVAKNQMVVLPDYRTPRGNSSWPTCQTPIPVDAAQRGFHLRYEPSGYLCSKVLLETLQRQGISLVVVSTQLDQALGDALLADGSFRTVKRSGHYLVMSR